MSKKNIIILLVAVVLLIVALSMFLYANSLGTKKDSASNSNSKSDHTITDSKVAKGPYFYDIDGNKLNFDDFDNNKPFTILLWKSDNANSYTMIDLITKYYEKYKDKINFLAINVNEPDLDLDLIENVKAVGFSIPIYFDTDATMYDEFVYEKLPDMLFLNPDRVIEKEALEVIEEDAFIANLDLLIKNY